MRCDEHGKVLETAAVWAAGDAIAYPGKQGGLAAQQADAHAGADVHPQPFRPMLRGVLLTVAEADGAVRHRWLARGRVEHAVLYSGCSPASPRSAAVWKRPGACTPSRSSSVTCSGRSVKRFA